MLTSPLRTEDDRAGQPGGRRQDPIRDEDRAVAVRRPVRVAIRQRRVVTTLGVLAAVLGVVAVAAGLEVAWAGVGLCLALTMGYMAAVAHIRRLTVEREMVLAFGPVAPLDADGWAALERDLAIASDGDPLPVPETGAQRGAVAKFVAASLLGWLLTPVVAVIGLAAGDLSDLRQRGVLDRLVRAQRYGRSQSLKMLSISVAATAGVTGVGLSAGVSMAVAAPAAVTTKPRRPL